MRIIQINAPWGSTVEKFTTSPTTTVSDITSRIVRWANRLGISASSIEVNVLVAG